MSEESERPTGEFDAVSPPEEDSPSVSFGAVKKPRKLTLEYLFELRRTFDELERSRHFVVDSWELHDPTPDVVVEMMEAGLGHSVPEVVLSFFQRVSDGVDFRWQWLDDDGEAQPGGELHIHNFGRVFGSWLDEIWGVVAEGASEEDEDFTWDLRGLESVDFGGTTYYTVMHVPEHRPDYALFFHAPGGETHRLNVDFIEYFESALETRGFRGWQFLVSDIDFSTHPEVADMARRFHSVMPRLFPETDFSEYRNPDDL